MTIFMPDTAGDVQTSNLRVERLLDYRENDVGQRLAPIVKHRSGASTTRFKPTHYHEAAAGQPVELGRSRRWR